MVDNISTYIDEINFPKNTTTEITDYALENTVTNKLTGGVRLEGDKLVIKGYSALTKISLVNHTRIEEVVIINCPNLEEVSMRGSGVIKMDIARIKTDDDTDDGGPDTTRKLKIIRVGGNPDFKEISLEFFPKLKEFTARGNTKVDKI